MPENTPRPRWRRVIGSPWFHLAAAFVVTGLLLSFVAKPYWVPSGSMETTLQPGELILRIRVPKTAMGRASTYHKIRDRESYAFALASAAVALEIDDDTVRAARIAIGGFHLLQQAVIYQRLE